MDASIEGNVVRFGLSKSKIAAFEQCPKRLWLQRYRPDLAEVDSGSAARFAAGHDVGAAACDLVSGGIMVLAEPDLAAAELRTRELLSDPTVPAIFEATLSVDGILVRIDILERDGSGGWRLAEVKSSTSVKPAHLGDVATQVWVAQTAGLNLSSAAIRHIDTSFVLDREGEYRGVFADGEVLADVTPIVEGRPAIAEHARAALEGPEPERETGSHCKKPYNCEFHAYCASKEEPGPEWPVTILPRGGGKPWVEAGIVDLLAIDEAALQNDGQKRIHRATVTGQPFHDVEGAKVAMSGWKLPRVWLDFETIAFALPRWIGTHPYEQVPFQFSAHIELAGGEFTHLEFLSLDGDDPRRRCAEALIAGIPETATIIAYNASFERGCLERLASACPDLAAPLLDMAGRLVDLLPVTRETWYHRDQRGSWSIKAVLPTVAPELAYSDLDVKGGTEAQDAYLEAIADGTSQERLEELARGLKAYCRRDTEAMIRLAQHLVGAQQSARDGCIQAMVSG